MASLHDILWNLRNEDLAYRLKLLGIKPRSPKKADLIDALKDALHVDKLKPLWESLDDLQRNVVSEVAYGTSASYTYAGIR